MAFVDPNIFLRTDAMTLAHRQMLQWREQWNGQPVQDTWMTFLDCDQDATKENIAELLDRAVASCSSFTSLKHPEYEVPVYNQFANYLYAQYIQEFRDVGMISGEQFSVDESLARNYFFQMIRLTVETCWTTPLSIPPPTTVQSMSELLAPR